MTASSVLWNRVFGLAVVAALASIPPTAPSAALRAADDPKPASKESRAAAAYERELKAALQAQQKLSAALQVLMSQDLALRGRIEAAATQAQLQMQAAERMGDFRLEQEPVREKGRKADRDDDKDEPRRGVRVVDQSRDRAAMATQAMQISAMLPLLNASLWRNHAALTKVAAESDTTRQQFRSLADSFGRRSSVEAERAVEIMNDALLGNPENDNARLVLALALVRLGRFAAAEQRLSELIDAAGPWQDVALAARGHLRAVGWTGDDPTTRRQGAAELNRAVALKSRQPEPYLFRALATWREGKWSQVEPDLKAALRFSPDHVDGLRLLASFYAASPNSERKLDDAEVAARRACELTAEQDAGCLEALAAVQARRGDWAAAIETQQKCAAVAAGDLAERAERRLGEYQANRSTDKSPPVVTTELPAPRLGPDEQAVEEKLEALRARPDAARPSKWFVDRGRFLALQRRWGPAAANLGRVAQPNPINEECFQYGCLLWLAGEKGEFRELCQRVAAGNAGEIGVRLASVTADSGLLPANVLQVALQPLATGATNPLTVVLPRHTVALAQYRAGQLGESRKIVTAEIEGAERMQPGAIANPKVLGLHWQLLALIEAREGRLEAAREAASKADGLNPDDPEQFLEPAAALTFAIWLEREVLRVELAELTAKKP